MFIPFIHVPAGGDGGGGGDKPDWLKLEPGERFVRAYGGGGKPKQLIAVKLGLALLVLAGLGNFYLFDRRTDIQIGADLWPILAVLIALLVLPLAMVTLARIRRGSQAFLTTRMLIVRQGRGYGGIPLGEITRVRTGSGLARRQVEVFTTSGSSPAACLQVADPRAAANELAGFAQAAGAKLS